MDGHESRHGFWLKYWPHLITAVILAFTFALPTSPDPAVLRVGHFLSKPFYNTYIVISYLLLIIPTTRLFPPTLRRSTLSAWWALDVAICTLILSQGLKYVLHMPRPSGGPSGAISGHTAFAIALAWLVSETYPRLSPIWFGLAIAVAWSRVEVGAHFPYQIPLGGILGALIGWSISHYEQGVIFPRSLRWRSARNT